MTHSGFKSDPGSSEAAIGYGSFSGLDPQRVSPKPAGWMFSPAVLYSTPSNVVTWDLALMNGKVLKPESYRLMTTNRLLKNGVRTGYCAGLAVKEVKRQIVLSHDGEPGDLSFNEFVPSTQSAFFITMNNQNVIKADLIEHLEPLLLPAEIGEPVPKIAGSNPITVAAQLFAAFQQGEIDRSLLSEDFDTFLTPEKVERAAHSLGN